MFFFVGDSEMQLQEAMTESPAARRKRMNMERMRRNRRNPIYRAEEQRRQRERRRQRLGVTKSPQRSVCRPAAVAPIRADGISNAALENMAWATAQVRPVREVDARTVFTPQETAVVEIPTVDGYPVLPFVVTLSVFAPVPSNITLVVVAGDTVKPPSTTVPVIPPGGHVSNIERTTVQMGRNLNLGTQGEFWYSNDICPLPPINAVSNGAIVKREM